MNNKVEGRPILRVPRVYTEYIYVYKYAFVVINDGERIKRRSVGSHTLSPCKPSRIRGPLAQRVTT